MTRLLLATLLAFTPVRSADTLAPAAGPRLSLTCGLSLLGIDTPSLPLVPLITSDVELAWGLTSRLDLRVHYRTYLGLVHRLGAELRAHVARAELGGSSLSVAARAFPTVQLVATQRHDEPFDVASKIASEAGGVLTWRGERFALSLEAGATIEWLVASNIDGVSRTDAAPYLATIDLALVLEWARPDDGTFMIALEAGVPTAPSDPYAPLGFYPRATFGGSFGL